MISSYCIILATVLCSITTVYTRHFVPLPTVPPANNLIHCLKSVLEEIIIRENSLLITLPDIDCLNISQSSFSEYTKYLDAILYDSLQRIHKELPSVVYKPLHSVKKKDDSFYSKNEIYLFLTLDQSCFSSQIQFLKSQINWNNKGKFILILPERMSHKVVENLLSQLWKFKIVNVIVIQNGVGSVDIYTWFPYRSENRCTDIKAELIDTWLPDKGGHFTKRSNKFPNKIPKNLHLCPLVASVIYWQYYAEFYAEFNLETKTVRRVFNKGLEIVLFQIISQKLNMTPKIIEPQFHVDSWGQLNEMENSTGILGDAKDDRANISIAGLPKNTGSLEKYLDSTVSYQESGFYWYIRCPRFNPHWEGLANLLPPLNLAVVLSVNISAAVLFWILGRSSQGERKILGSFSSCCQMVFLIMLNSCTHNVPRTNIVRAFFLFLLYYAFLFNTIFQTLLTQRLIDPGKERRVTNLEEIINSGINISLLYGHEGIFRNPDTLEKQVLSRYSFCKGGVKACASKVAFEGDAVTVMDNKMYQEIQHNYLDEINGPLLCRLNDMIMPYRISMYVTKGFPLLERIDDIILTTVEAGLLEHWWSIYLAEIRRKIRFRGKEEIISYEEFTLAHLYVVFIIIHVGFAFSVLLFLCEICLSRAKK